jgi:hypothetical protein
LITEVEPLRLITEVPLITEVEPLQLITEVPLITEVEPLQLITEVPLITEVEPLRLITEVPLITEVEPLRLITEVPLIADVEPLPSKASSDSTQLQEGEYVEDFMRDDSYSPSMFAKKFNARHEENLNLALNVFGPADDTSDGSSLGGLEFRSQKKLKTIEGVLVNEAILLQRQNSSKTMAERNRGKFTRAQSGIILTPD